MENINEKNSTLSTKEVKVKTFLPQKVKVAGKIILSYINLEFRLIILSSSSRNVPKTLDMFYSNQNKQHYLDFFNHKLSKLSVSRELIDHPIVTPCFGTVVECDSTTGL